MFQFSLLSQSDGQSHESTSYWVNTSCKTHSLESQDCEDNHTFYTLLRNSASYGTVRVIKHYMKLNNIMLYS